MSELIYLWRVHCNFTDTDEFIWTDVEPTVCPVAHPDMTIDSARTAIVDSTRIENEITISPAVLKVNNNDFFRVGGYILPTLKHKLFKIEVISFMDTAATSYDIKILDVDNQNIIANANFTNTSEAMMDLGTLTNVPDGNTQLDILVRKNGGGISDYAYVTSISFLFRQDTSL